MDAEGIVNGWNRKVRKNRTRMAATNTTEMISLISSIAAAAAERGSISEEVSLWSDGIRQPRLMKGPAPLWISLHLKAYYGKRKADIFVM